MCWGRLWEPSVLFPVLSGPGTGKTCFLWDTEEELVLGLLRTGVQACSFCYCSAPTRAQTGASTKARLWQHPTPLLPGPWHFLCRRRLEVVIALGVTDFLHSWPAGCPRSFGWPSWDGVGNVCAMSLCLSHMHQGTSVRGSQTSAGSTQGQPGEDLARKPSLKAWLGLLPQASPQVASAPSPDYLSSFKSVRTCDSSEISTSE